MAIADLLVGAISMPLNVAIDILIAPQVFYTGFRTLHLAAQFSEYTFIWSSLYHLTFITWEIIYSGFCKLHLATQFSMFTFIWSSLRYHLTFIAWERYVAIRKWIEYKVIVTRSRMKNLAIMAWLLAAFATSPHLVMILVGVKESWHIGESVVVASCLKCL